MGTMIITICLGLAVCVIGIVNMKGKVSSLHQYHRKRVREENKKAFCKLVGLGTLIIGIALIVYGTLFFVFEKTQWKAFAVIGTVELMASIIAGMTINFYAMKKYNGGVF